MSEIVKSGLPDVARADIVGLLTAAYAQIEDMIGDYADDPAALATALVGMDELKKQHGVVRDAIEHALVAAMPAKTAEIAGVGVLSVKTDVSRTGWQHQDLLWALVSEIRERGEGDTPTELVEALAACISFSSWKSNPTEGTGLAKWGIDRDEYCSTRFGRKKIQFVTPKTKLQKGNSIELTS